MITHRKIAATVALALLTVALAAAPESRTLKAGTPASVAMDAAKLDEAVALYRRAVERDDLRGAVLLVARHGTIVLHEAVGWRHRGYRLPMEKDTLFRMASNNKPVVAAGALRLEEQGRLELDDRAAAYLPSFDHDRARNITILHLPERRHVRRRSNPVS